jgi:hypothetical protein
MNLESQKVKFLKLKSQKFKPLKLQLRETYFSKIQLQILKGHEFYYSSPYYEPASLYSVHYSFPSPLFKNA